jgi:hypothetical protein
MITTQGDMSKKPDVVNGMKDLMTVGEILSMDTGPSRRLRYHSAHGCYIHKHKRRKYNSVGTTRQAFREIFSIGMLSRSHDDEVECGELEATTERHIFVRRGARVSLRPRIAILRIEFPHEI